MSDVMMQVNAFKIKLILTNQYFQNVQDIFTWAGYHDFKFMISYPT